jgi:hypothetical protein
LAQTPQLLGSVVVSTQAPPHSMRGKTQAKSHSPAAQTGVALLGAMHTVAQSPQWAVLVFRSTQEPPQSVVVPGHVPPQLPPAHTSWAPQTVGQLPQCALSDFKSTQTPPQSV